LFHLEGSHSAQTLLQDLAGRLTYFQDHIVAILFIVAAAGVAVNAPGVGGVLGFVGALAAIPIMFILPPFIALHIPRLGVGPQAGNDLDVHTCDDSYVEFPVRACQRRCAIGAAIIGILLCASSTYGQLPGEEPALLLVRDRTK